MSFINRGSTIPTRREFADYLSWAAREVEKRGIQVAYAEEVIGISKVHADDYERELIEVTSRLIKTGELVTRRTSMNHFFRIHEKFPSYAEYRPVHQNLSSYLQAARQLFPLFYLLSSLRPAAPGML